MKRIGTPKRSLSWRHFWYRIRPASAPAETISWTTGCSPGSGFSDF
jgi:hypothetical protein